MSVSHIDFLVQGHSAEDLAQHMNVESNTPVSFCRFGVRYLISTPKEDHAQAH